MALKRPTTTGGTKVPWSDWYVALTPAEEELDTRVIVLCTTGQQLDRVLAFAQGRGRGAWLRFRVHRALPYYPPSRTRVRWAHAVNFLEMHDARENA